MRHLYIIMLCLLALHTSGQTPLLKEIDDEAGDLMSMTDANKYSYDHQLWAEHSLSIIANIDSDTLKAYKPVHLKRIDIPEVNSTIMYYIRSIGNQVSIDWMIRREEEQGIFTNIFTDIFSSESSNKNAVAVKPVYSRHIIGFEVVDTATHNRLYWMPDITMRLAFETVADIKASNSDKELGEDIIKRRLKSMFSYDDALTINTEGLPRLYSQTSQDKTVRIITFMTVFGDMTSRCNGLVLHRKKDGNIDMFELDDKTEDIGNPERVKLNASKWYGAVYYDMIEATYDKTTYYTLLGYKSNDGMVKTRVIDALWFSGKKCMFGAPIFEHEKATYSRRVFRYSAGVNMMMRYDDKLKSIVFDHLAPENSMFIGEYRFYGPDWSYDSYTRQSKYWFFKEDIELRNQQ